jgi:hypothetical protein
MFDEKSARVALDVRQRLRNGAALPSLDIDAELKAMREKADRDEASRAFENWKASNPDLVKALREEALNELRTKGNRPADWRPSGMLSGGGLWFELMIRARLREAFRTSMARTSRFVCGPDDVEHHRAQSMDRTRGCRSRPEQT